MEGEALRKRRWGHVQQATLAAVGITGILLVSMAAPNVLQLLGKMPRNKYRFTHQAKSALSRLAAKGHIQFVERGGKKYAHITEKGQRALLLDEGSFRKNNAGRRWDKRWRVVLFDIPERRRKTRDQLRIRMRSLGFYRLQDSAWVYPHDCEDIVALLKSELHLGYAVIYMIVESIENDNRLKQEFGLSSYS